jgi:hypothetical protein
MRPHPRRAETDPGSPKSWATCDRCGFITNHYKLSWQFDWAGTKLVNKRILVCEGGCLDEPQRQLGTILLPPDPMPIMNARPERYALDEEPISARYTLDGRVRVVAYLPYPVDRVVTVQGFAPADDLHPML